MENGDKPINPLTGSEGSLFVDNGIDEDWIKSSRPLIGITKREYFAAMAMQGLSMNRTLIYDYIGDETKVQFSELISKEAIRIADELLKQLES